MTRDPLYPEPPRPATATADADADARAAERADLLEDDRRQQELDYGELGGEG